MTQSLVIRQDSKPEFQVASRTVKNPYKFTFGIDFGSEPGAWFMIIINRTAYGFGYLPRAKKEKHAASTKGSPLRGSTPAESIA